MILVPVSCLDWSGRDLFARVSVLCVCVCVRDTVCVCASMCVDLCMCVRVGMGVHV